MGATKAAWFREEDARLAKVGEVECARCGERVAGDDAVCGGVPWCDLLPEERGGNVLCSWCWHMSTKDD